ncbi:DUF5305 family protein [Halonotius roseus]|uniref:DUF5305 domain-containing protein n=1 Tax=Halonotius roseus TaxID=2511997 RepID=A0A544QS80_9EURY|nr:DUF5305 family protein [Halonotius roseus]TQQ82288.1 hypothetical protein EWF95_05005 [Halonotius roseus]
MLPRLKLQVATNTKEFTIGFVVLGVVLLLGSGYVFLTPPVEEPASQPEPQPAPGPETEEFEAFFLDVELIDSAVVKTASSELRPTISGPNQRAYEEGEVITRAPAYFYRYTPDLTFNVTATTTKNVSVDLTTRLIREEEVVTDREDADSEIVYTNDRLLMYRQDTVTDGRVTNRRAFDVRNDLERRADEVAADFPSSTTSLNTQLILTVDYETEPINGTAYNGTLNMTPSLESNNDAYWITGDQQANVSETQTRTIEPAETADPAGAGQPTEPSEPTRGEPNMGLVALLAMLGLVAVAGGGAIAAKAPQLDEAELKTEIAHNQYSEWISEGELLLDSDNEFVSVNSIEDLVNVGIDANKRVIYDPDLSVYTVADGDVTYYYTTEPASLQRWTHL